MATFKFEGIDDYIAQLHKLYGNVDEMIGRSIYEGAAVVMQSVVSAIEGIATDNRPRVPEGTLKNGPSTRQKRWLQHSIGIASLRQDGTFWNVKIGFDGYNDIVTERWPQGQPNAMVARSIESGTSFMAKQSFMRKAEQSSRVRCEQAMAKEIDKELTKIIKENK